MVEQKAKRRSFDRKFLEEYCNKNEIKYDHISEDVNITRETIITGTCINDLCIKKFEKTFLCIIDRGGAYCNDCTKERSITSRIKKRRKPLEEFIQEANIKHKNKYLYKKCIYTTTHEYVIITCREHGDFEQRPSNHLTGNGCPRCGRERTTLSQTFTNEQFIGKSNQIHNNLYTYANTKYIDYTTPVLITCREHGDFEQKPREHLTGNGCQECGGVKPITQEDFISRSNIIHKDKYDYSLVKYKSRLEPVIIICPTHGEFTQCPKYHYLGGCFTCGIESSKEKQRITEEEFILRSEEIHNNKYNYDDMKYINQDTEITIICPEHGIFSQLPSYHIRGSGCIKCSGTYQFTEQEVIQKFVDIHGDKYDYSNINYINAYTSVSIRCKLHNIEFIQSPRAHYNNYTACRLCINEKIKATCITKYGTEHFMQNSEIADKASKNAYKSYNYIFPSGRIDKIQGYEKFALDELLKEYDENDIITMRSDVPEIWYVDEKGQKHRHYGDIFIKSKQLFIEVKSPWTAEKKKDNIFLKQNAGKELGYQYEIWIYDAKGNKVECYK